MEKLKESIQQVMDYNPQETDGGAPLTQHKIAIPSDEVHLPYYTRGLPDSLEGIDPRIRRSSRARQPSSTGTDSFRLPNGRGSPQDAFEPEVIR